MGYMLSMRCVELFRRRGLLFRWYMRGILTKPLWSTVKSGKRSQTSVCFKNWSDVISERILAARVNRRAVWQELRHIVSELQVLLYDLDVEHTSTSRILAGLGDWVNQVFRRVFHVLFGCLICWNRNQIHCLTLNPLTRKARNFMAYVTSQICCSKFVWLTA